MSLPSKALQAVSGFDLFGGGVIKSVQRGELILGLAGNEIAIDSVDLTKSIVRCTIKPNTGLPAFWHVKAELINDHTLGLSTFMIIPSTNYQPQVMWEVIEFENVKSLQKGDIIHEATSSGTFTEEISPVDINKALLFVSYAYDRGGVGDQSGEYSILSSQIISESRIRFRYLTQYQTFDINWQVIEFE